MNSNKKRIPDIVLERFILDEVNESERQSIKQLLQTDKELQSRYTSFCQGNYSFLQTNEFKECSNHIRLILHTIKVDQSLKTIKSNFFSLSPYSLGVAGLCLSAILVFLIISINQLTPLTHKSIPTGIRVKGLLPSISIYEQQDSKINILSNNDTVVSGALLQIGYTALGKNYGIIFSIDGNGTVSLHYPDSPENIPNLKQEGEILLPIAYELDNAPYFEHFYFLTSDSLFNVQSIMTKVEAQIKDSSSKISIDNFTHYSIKLRKKTYEK